MCMKKLLLLIAFVVVSFAVEAQLFVAGGISGYHLGGSTINSSSTIDYKPKENGFAVTPAVGYMIPGKNYGFGLSLGYAYISVKENVDIAPNLNNKVYSNTIDIAPFFRYAYAKFDKITLYVDAKLPIGISNSKQKYANLAADLSRTFVIGARLIPGLTYKFNNHILFTTEIGLLSINYLHTKTTHTIDVVDINNEFRIGANNRTIASFGFVYLF